jgi:hypothetical protein
MTDILVYEVFRNANGSLATQTNVKITARNSATVLFDLTTDGLGTVSIYLPPGQYDWLVRGDRTPFDVIPAAVGGVAGYVHHQSSPSAQWTITHMLGVPRTPTVLTDSDPTNPVWTNTEHPDVNTTLLTFPSAETGWAYL